MAEKLIMVEQSRMLKVVVKVVDKDAAVQAAAKKVEMA